MLKKTAIIVAGVAVLVGSIAYSKAKDSKADSRAKPQAVASNDAADKSVDKSVNKVVDRAADQYWIGVRCVAPVPEMVRAHVEVPQDGGIFVAHVVPKGPAAEAGIERHDIILAVGDKSLKKVADLIAAVDQSQGEKLTLKILRGGKLQDITLAPLKRPAEFTAKGSIAMPPGSKWHKLGEWFDQSRPGRDGRPPLRMRFMHPGMILPPLPSGMTVTVTRKGDKPAQITVKRDGKQWKITADELHKLPDDIRPHVARMIGGLNVAPSTSPGMLPPGMLPPGMLRDKLKLPDPAAIEKSVGDRIQKQIDAMNRQMKKLEKMAEDLRKERTLQEPKQSQAKAEKKTQPDPKTDK